LSCTSKTVLVTGAEACGVVWAGCLVFLFFLSDCPGLFLLGVLLERNGGRDSVVSVAFFCFSIAGTASSGAVLVVLVTNAAGTCGSFWVGTDFLLFVRGRHSTGKGGRLLGKGLAGFAFLCNFKGRRGVPLGGTRGTVSSGAILVVLNTDAGDTCGNVWVGAAFLLFARGRHGNGEGGSLLGDGFSCSAGFAFLCGFKGGRRVPLGGTAGTSTVSSCAVLAVLVTKAGGACGKVCEGADFLWSVWGRHGTGEGDSNVFFFPAGFAFLCSFKV
jgi:hypothetical protein